MVKTQFTLQRAVICPVCHGSDITPCEKCYDGTVNGNKTYSRIDWKEYELDIEFSYYPGCRGEFDKYGAQLTPDDEPETEILSIDAPFEPTKQEREAILDHCKQVGPDLYAEARSREYERD